ncbi:23S rRNA (uridine2552-2'-O)-methyltransferase [Methylomagnum ishizawai]|uniref:Ribosomal RNA large subunit methyltransferase E n=1 Tax=Methylomagnum ishizawai TaxID=1760988 RepID=A0A1Y6CX96_9GAMM|nr:23S rRNA (uridine(2552)-2'-O)-methyltransferase RlmE [Methylomagnum ishizawai]SMF95288.1 23S rRNA (uridine2552-2'-O)-methyltransferase [Methylomagnum ishizawai]
MARSRSSGRWLSEHFSDEYVKLAQAQGYRSRAVFKLKELDERERLFKPGMAVIDLGAAPGGWSQYAAERIGKSGKIIALDLLPVEAMPGVVFIQGDFREEAVLEQLRAELSGQLADLVLSDMAPNTTGVNAVDQARSMVLAELALDTARETLKPGGGFVVKLFQGPDFDAYVKAAREVFAKVTVRKPKASRDRSPEVYLVGKAARK